MAACRLIIEPSARDDLDALPNKADRRRVVARIEALADDPRPVDCRKLTGRDHYRVRQGRDRLVYQIRDGELVVLVVRIGDRRDVDRGL